MKKDNQTKERLLQLAKEEFQKKGYSGVSMRDISSITGMALGNIYYYFKTKDELFVEILKPAIKNLHTIIEKHNAGSNLTTDIFPDEYKNDDVLWEFYQTISLGKDELYLLFFGANGSSLEGFSDELIGKLTKMGTEYINKMKGNYPEINSDIDPFFMHMYAAIQVSVIKQIVLHRKIPDDRLKDFSHTYTNYTRAGWKFLMRI